jgi:hypothetical protein
MTVEQAAAGSSTLIALLVGLGIGGFILVPVPLCSVQARARPGAVAADVYPDSLVCSTSAIASFGVSA